MEELIHETVLHKAPVVKLTDFVGGFNLLSSVQQDARIVPDPSYAEIRHVRRREWWPGGCAGG
jgi:hypothetical protein